MGRCCYFPMVNANEQYHLIKFNPDEVTSPHNLLMVDVNSYSKYLAVPGRERKATCLSALLTNDRNKILIFAILISRLAKEL